MDDENENMLLGARAGTALRAEEGLLLRSKGLLASSPATRSAACSRCGAGSSLRSDIDKSNFRADRHHLPYFTFGDEDVRKDS